MHFWIACICIVSFLSSVHMAYALSDGDKHPGGQNTLQTEIQPAVSNNELLTRLPNGLTVYIIRDTRFPLALTRLYVHTGSSNEHLDQAGISHVLEHMVFKGTDHRPKGKVAQDVEALGGYLNAATSFDKTWYLTDMPSSHWKMGMDVVYDMAFKASLDANELESEKDVVISELQGGDDNPNHKLYEDLQTATLKHSVYGRPVIGFEKQIRNLTSQSLREYRDYWYQPQNMDLLVAGDIEPEKVLAYAQTLFGEMKNTTDLASPAPVDLSSAPDEQIVSIRRGPWKKVYLGIAFPAPSFRDLRSVDLDVLCYLLGGDATSRFFKKYKYDAQLVDDISVNNMSLMRGGLLSVTVELTEDKVAAFWDAFTKDLATMKADDFTSESIKRAVLNIEDSLNRAGETLNSLVSWKSTVQFTLGGAAGEENLRNRLESVHPALLDQSIRDWFDPQRARVRVLAPDAAVLPDFAEILQANWSGTKRHDTAAGNYMEGEKETVSLENGCTLILLPDTHAPYVSLNMTSSGGNSLLDTKKQGLAHLTAALLRDGCGDMNKEAVETYLAARASSMDFVTGKQIFLVKMEGPSQYTEDLLHLLDQTLASPQFDAKELDRERIEMKGDLRRRADNALATLFSSLWPRLYPNHCYGFDDLGTEALLDTYTVSDVRQFWAQQREEPWVLAVCGSFERDRILAFAKKHAATKKIARQRVAIPNLGAEKRFDWQFPGRVQAHVVKLFPTVAQNHEDAPALMLLSSVLSGQSGLLFSSMRDKEGLGYTVTSFVRFHPEAGSLIFYIGTVKEKIELAEQGFVRVIHDITEKPLAADLLKAGVNRMMGAYVRGTQSLASRADEAAQDAILGYPPQFRKVLLERAAQLTPADLLRVARKYLQLPKAYTAVLQP